LSCVYTQFHNYSDEISRIKEKLKTDRCTGLQPSVSKKSKGEENEKDSEGNESCSEMKRKA
jgi:hypothetical protein